MRVISRFLSTHPDWRFLVCQVCKGSTVYVTTVGTFGITSASYFWNRVAAICRISQHVVADSAATWLMLVADDYPLEAGGQEYRFDLMTFFIVCSIVGVPLSWNKTSGGETVTCVGFELLHRARQLGISQRRADWFRKWTTEVASSSSVHMTSFEEGLGRVMRGHWSVRGLFLGPLCRFMSLHPRDSVRAVPPNVSFFLRHLAAQIWECRHHDVSRSGRAQGRCPSPSRPHRCRRMVPLRRSVGTGECQIVKMVVPRDHQRWVAVGVFEACTHHLHA